MMDQINDWLFIGGYRDRLNQLRLQEAGIEAMLHLAEDVRLPRITTLFIDMADGEPFDPQKIAEGMAFVAAQRAAGKKILIACGAGISRSATFCMAALHQEIGINLAEAYRLIAEKHPVASPHHALLKVLAEYYHADYEGLVKVVYHEKH